MYNEARDEGIRAMIRDFDAPPDTVQIDREKREGDDVVIAFNFRDASNGLVRACIGVHRLDGDRWLNGGSWASSQHAKPDGILTASGGWAYGPPDLLPGQASVRGVAAGWVDEPTAKVIRVTDPTGRVEDDTIDGGVAILMWVGGFDASRAVAELLDERGQLIRSGPIRPPI